MTDDVICRKEGRVGWISLNRPRAIHSLTLPMCEAMTAALMQWEDDGEVDLVIVDHAEGRGFCAGGDVVMLRASGMTDGVEGRRFFHAEYQLNHLMFTYAKPIVAFMDGITMGGGVGISQPARYRIATEHTRFAMPETGIGLFPDVGGGWYLSRLPGRTGQFLALTGARMDGAECVELGLATHYLSADALAEAKQRIVAHPDRVEGILGSLSITPPAARIDQNRQVIDRLFASNSLEIILDALKADGGEWAQKELVTLRAKSPRSCKVTLRQLAESDRCRDFADNMRMEYRIGCRQLMSHDFIEGVRALLVDKTNDPRWDPATPEAFDDAALDAVFAPLPAQEEWQPAR